MKRTIRRYRAAWVLALLGAGLLVQGCGLGTAGIIILAMGGGEEETTETAYHPPPASNLLFEEDFETDLSQWSAVGSPLPSISTDPGDTDNTTQFWVPGGNETAPSEVLSRPAFPLDPGVALIASIRSEASGSDPCTSWFGFKSRCCADADPGLGAGFFFDAQLQRVDFMVNETSEANRVLTDENWHTYMVFVQPDGLAAFYIDGTLEYLSTAQVRPDMDHAPITAGGFPGASAGRLRIDDIKVTGTGSLRTVEFGDGFTYDPALSWSLGSTGGAAQPSRDDVTSGFPLPGLNPGGGATGVGRALSTALFDVTQGGMEACADLVVTQLSTLDEDMAFGFCAQTNLSGAVSLMAGVRLDPTSGSDVARFLVDQGGGETEVTTMPLDTSVHRYRIVVRSDLRVEFYVDGVLLDVSQPVAASFSSQPVLVEGRAASGTPRADNVCVLSPAHEGAPTGSDVPDAAGPGTLKLHTAVWDDVGDRMIVFGGIDSVASPVSGVWALSFDDTGQAAWTTLAPTGSGPVALQGHTAVWDGEHRAMVVFGGRDGSNALQDAAYALDFSTSEDGTWVALGGTSTPPSPRWKHAAAFDPHEGRMIVFGGETSGGAVGDVHVLGLSAYDPQSSTSTAWTTPVPSGGPPAARYGHTAAFDRAGRSMIVVGGRDGSNMIPAAQMIWFLETPVGSGPMQWTQGAHPGGFDPRESHDACIDSLRRRLLVYGGVNSFTSTEYPELWVFDLAGGWWYPAPVLDTVPPGVEGVSCAFRPGGTSAFALGGEAGGTVDDALTDLEFKDNSAP
jgi:hypothetical protein